MALALPSEQFRENYSFLVPSKYDEQYISVVAIAGEALMLNGVDRSDELTPFGSGSYSGEESRGE